MKNKETLSLKDKFEFNPFVKELKGKMYLQAKNNVIVAKNEAIVDTITGELKNSDHVLMGNRRIVDKSQFAKIYVTELGTLLELSKTAINTLMYLMKVMDYDNRAYFSYTTEYEKVGYKSSVPLFKALKELIKREIIAPDMRTNSWWLNPIYVCKGERFSKYTEFVTEEYAERNNMMAKQVEREKEIINQDGIGTKVLLAEKQQDNNYYNMNQLEMDI